MALHLWRSFLLLCTLTGLRRASAQQFVSDNLLTSGGEESVCLSRSGGYYADLADDCSSYTLCAPGGRQFDFSCPPGTRFHQQFLVCDHEFRVDCAESPRYYALNELIGREEQGAESTKQETRTTPTKSSQTQFAVSRAPLKPLVSPQRPLNPVSSSPAPRRSPFTRPQAQRPTVSRAATPSPRAPVRALPVADVGQTLLDLVQLSTRESRQRPAADEGSPRRPGAVGVEPRSRQPPVSPAVPALLTQVAALGRTAPQPKAAPRVRSEAVPQVAPRSRPAAVPQVAPPSRPSVVPQVAPRVRPGLTQEASLRRPAARRQQAPSFRGTFFPARPELPRKEPRQGFSRFERLNKSLPSPPAGNKPSRPRGVGRKVRFPARKVRPEPPPPRLPAGRRQSVRAVGGGWRPALRSAPGTDPRCPRCLAALITRWDSCFPCVSVLR
ncbi:translation initiation factor IF-2-like [Amphibalanus amphitrite]|uniref:translation initiation factor IF-2-like n=1 Tax=Amphibalanus amphitrite TaxID=1232801 RepID=UPI001C90ED20|nr:translation initiation factor IF-2-like [Amphibalanus amphitrite]